MTLRHRSGGGYSASTITQVTNTSGNVQWTTTNPGNGKVFWMSDVVVPQFHQRSAAGEIIMNPMTRVVDTFESSGVGYQIRIISSKETEQGNGNMMYYLTGLGHGSVPFLVPQSDVDSILSELCTKVRSKRGSGDAGSWENLAEWRSTIDMIRRPVASFWRFDRRFPKSSIAKSASNAWLQYRYGLAPLVRDLTTIVKNLQSQRPPRKTTRATISVNRNDTQVRNIVTGIITTPVTFQTTEKYTARVMSIDEVEASLSLDLGFTAKDLIRLPYDLTRLSFVADWFVNVGDYINAVSDYVVGPKNLGGCMVGHRELSQTATCGGSFLNSHTSLYTLERPFSGITKRTSDIVQRSPGLLAPSLVVNTDFGLDRAVRLGDSVSLIAQRLLSNFRGR